MTKTPDEIKKGLECCKFHDGDMYTDCSPCPYYLTSAQCDLDMHDDAIALIQQLEKRAIHLEALNQSNLTTITMQERTRARFQEWISQLEAERDAAVEELANSDSPCDFCKYLKKFAHETPCNNCVHVLHGEESQFKWRGVQKEE